jgi:hypothetical protein|tara:strand:+ start:690 stop:893 length:204 start_codon:yes stop_codon:yes gene_type:complete
LGLFPNEGERAIETMALAFHEKNKWDMRWFRMQLIGYSVGSAFVSAASVTICEYYFDFSLFGWFFNL